MWSFETSWRCSSPSDVTFARQVMSPCVHVPSFLATSEALDFFERGFIKAPFKTIGMSELQKVYDLMHEGKIAGRYVVDSSK
ncbi:MAG: Alcohol dehydrogenase [Heterodermia speciosa]|uniref:Alcohol dehydrogenase n=1 Tax=Heterodermia speciosa TaxID=116794 RepID=A0A8H3G3R0_9LECA|nr:MAG: Alcohol dehydrogenase [Heterodermia speciosa]